jgi:hypothetical protein
MKYYGYSHKSRFAKTYDEPLKQILAKTRWYWDHDGVPPHVRAAFRKVLQCRTRALGAERFASAFAPRTRLGLFFRNQVIKMAAIPGFARLTFGGDIIDTLELPDYQWLHPT